MGEVFKAKDQKLGREVAIKVLPEEFAKDADRVARFQREAKLLASLNHSNIAAIYGLEESGGTNFLVLELVEGDTLADQLKRGPIPVEESLKLALQIAEALEAAHEKGVIHRDLKPANIKVTPDGKVKVLDFGLAKAYAGEQAELNLSNSPTLSDAATRQGVILGTAAYMSPEQARGKAVDKRTDIWAFGCVLYEMLTGQAAFQGEDVTEILAAVVKSGVNLDLLPANLHFRVREAIIRCLQKEPKRRYSSITDARYEIEQALADPGGILMQQVTAVKQRKKLRLGLAWVAAAVILAAIIAGVAGWNLKPSEPRHVIRFYHELQESQQFGNLTYSVLAISPDDRQFVYSTSTGLYLRQAGELNARLIPGTEEQPSSPFFSPDGQWIGYWSMANSQLKKIAISGGAPVALCDVSIFVDASWNADNTIVYGQYPDSIRRVSANGGTSESLIKASPLPLFSPQILPGGKSVLFSMATTEGHKIAVQSLESGKRKELFIGDRPRYLPTGHLIYIVGNDLLAVPFDADTLEVTGGPVAMVAGIWQRSSNNASQYAISDSGTLAYLPGIAGAASVQRTLVWLDRKGKEAPIAVTPNDYRNPRISPDGSRVALTVYSGSKRDIWILDIVREIMTRLTFNENSTFPLWTLDGRRIAFATGDLTKSAVYLKAADGTGTEEKLVSAQDRAIAPWSWSSDGKLLILHTFNLSGGLNADIGALPMEGDRKWRPLLTEKYHEGLPQISSDGRWMAYQSNESGRFEVYVRPFPDVNKGKWQVSMSGGDLPLWAPGGKELFYRNGDSVMAVAVQTEPTFKPGKTETLFRGPYVQRSSMNAHPWDISPDGKRFLMMKEAGATPSAAEGPRKINIVLNWFEELKQRVPAK
jgi:serine/threonine-protein kinase